MRSSHLFLCVLICSFCLRSLGSSGPSNFVVMLTSSSFASESTCSSLPQVTSDPNRVTVRLVHRHGPCAPSGGNTSKPMPSLAERLRGDRARRNLFISKAAALSDAGVNIPTALGGAVDSLAEYVVTLGLGTPAVQQTVSIDTGSDLSWVQCKPCNSTACYPQKDPLLDPSKSSTYKAIACQSDACKSINKDWYHGDCTTDGTQCRFSIGPYGDGSNTTGVYSTDTLTLEPGVTIKNFSFGCGHDQEGLHDSNDGLLGLGGAPESLVSQAAEQYGRAFSYCLPPGKDTSGFLALGAPSNNSNTAGFVFAPMHRLVPGVATFYMVNLAGISVGGKQLDIPLAAFPKHGMIVDSGSVVTQLPEAAYSALRSAFRSAMPAYPLLPPNKDDLDTCYNFTGFSNVTVPKVSLTFSGGATIDLDVPSGVLVEGCLAFYGDNGLFGIIGNVNQRTFEVLYDLYRGNIGFRPGAC